MGADRAAVPAARRSGFTLCRHIGPEAELLLIGVDPAARRSGVGRALLGAAAADAARRDATTMFLEVRDGNTAALALYRAAGYYQHRSPPRLLSRRRRHPLRRDHLAQADSATDGVR